MQPPGLTGLLTSQTAEKEKIRLARAVAEPRRQLVELTNVCLPNPRAKHTAHLGKPHWLVFLIAGHRGGLRPRITSRSAPPISEISVTLSDATGDLTASLGPWKYET